MTDKTPSEMFLEELTELSLKHNVWISGCGCCGSPWIDDYNTEKEQPTHYLCDQNPDRDGYDRLKPYSGRR